MEINEDEIKVLKNKLEEKLNNSLSIPRRKFSHFLITLTDNTQTAVSIVKDKNQLSQEDIERLWVEKQYWAQKSVTFKLLDHNDINKTLAHNIRLVVEYYDKDTVHDETSAIKYLIANKILQLDLTRERLNIDECKKLLTQKGLELW